MSGEKTEQPTPKRLRDARKKGQVAKSQDLTQAVLLVAAFGVLAAGADAYVSELRHIMVDLFQPQLLTGTLNDDELVRRAGHASNRALLLITPLLGAVFLVAGALNFLQVKALFSAEVLKPKLDKLNPIKGFQNLFFKSRTYLELLKTLIKFAVVGATAYVVLAGSLRDIVLTARTELKETGSIASDLLFGIAFKIGAAFIILGAADYLLQKRLHLKSLKMSKYEVHREYKDDEGDPHLKHMRKQLHEQMLASGTVAKVASAQAVVVNPTHIAVALEYDEGSMNAPVVSAKGQLLMAQRIIAVARQHRVPIVRQISLAHRLYKVETGSEIPDDLYAAVAEILNWVYQLAQRELAEENA
jgi:type III secretion YscU/HrpY family protein